MYRNGLRSRLNLYQPSAKLIKTVRSCSKLRRRYDLPCTPLDRLGAGEADEGTVRTPVAALLKVRQGLDPFELSRQIDRKLPAIYALAHTRLSPRVPPKGPWGRDTSEAADRVCPDK